MNPLMEKDLKQSMELLKHICYPSNGMVFIIHDNHIGYLATGRLVIKEGHLDDNAYVKKNNKEWIRYVPYKEIPMIIDPEKEYIVVANNKFIPDYELSWNSQPTSRARRLNDLINQNRYRREVYYYKSYKTLIRHLIVNTKNKLMELLYKYDQKHDLSNEISILENWTYMGIRFLRCLIIWII
ncbi:unnamed protein product (macronuclear) [Paramecium tetraurelia]|uniref:Uncharacterized protein n=1 Tax=Paramecium tetraurelia TaxID=5888 RepID=A0DYL2_PARTE|nr:uncharacterized protein GSPATT00003097001 [Paramecium tetraurelia]CAK88129.1 unnamed protein product [Paramecium tetraurelia]|eukprot:XP_001455526.1 hypothetical protein (macronuclear) [Paramecium tetraurelia strain d4-2]